MMILPWYLIMLMGAFIDLSLTTGGNPGVPRSLYGEINGAISRQQSKREERAVQDGTNATPSGKGEGRLGRERKEQPPRHGRKQIRPQRGARRGLLPRNGTAGGLLKGEGQGGPHQKGRKKVGVTVNPTNGPPQHIARKRPLPRRATGGLRSRGEGRGRGRRVQGGVGGRVPLSGRRGGRPLQGVKRRVMPRGRGKVPITRKRGGAPSRSRTTGRSLQGGERKRVSQLGGRAERAGGSILERVRGGLPSSRRGRKQIPSAGQRTRGSILERVRGGLPTSRRGRKQIPSAGQRTRGSILERVRGGLPTSRGGRGRGSQSGKGRSEPSTWKRRGSRQPPSGGRRPVREEVSKGILGEVHVNEKNGSDTSICGNISSPCHTLEMGIKQVKESGKVFVTGIHYITSKIKLFKSVSLIGSDGAMITSRRLPRAIEISSMVNVTFESLRIQKVGLVDIKWSATIIITRCVFEGQTVRTRILRMRGSAYRETAYIETTSDSVSFISLNISNTKFKKTSDPIRLLFRKSSHLSRFTNVLIKNCVFIDTGMSMIQDVQGGVVQDTIFNNDRGLQFVNILSDICIKRCRFMFGKNHGLRLFSGGIVTRHYDRTLVTISDNLFANFVASGARLYLRGFRDILIKNCVFSNLTTKYDSPIYLIQSGNIRITNITCHSNTITDRDGACMSIRDTVFAFIEKSKFMNNVAVKKNGAVFIGKSEEKNRFRRPLTVALTDCWFLRNHADSGGSLSIFDANVMIKRSIFVDNKALRNGGAIARISTLKRFLTIVETIFSNCSAGSQGGALFVSGKCNLQLRNSLLVDNLAKVSSGGMHMVSEISDRSRGIINQTRFINCSSPSIFLYSSTIGVSNMTFRTTDITPISHIQLNGKNIVMKNIQMTLYYPKSVESNTILKMMSVVSSNELNISNGISVSCSPNFNADILSPEEPSRTTQRKMEVRCQTCPTKMYTLTNTLKLQHISNQILKTIPKCLKCPSGALCDGKVVVIDNYWGSRVVDELKVMPCPEGYCCSSQSTTCESYNTCNGPRIGTLCGTCAPNYMQSYMTNECVLKGEKGCDIKIFMAYFILVSLGYAVALTFPQSIVNYMKKYLSRFKKNTNETEEIPERVDDVPEISIGAFFTLVIYYLQIISLVHIDVVQKDMNMEEFKRESDARRIIFDTSNFQLSLQENVCPVDNLTLIGKLFTNIGLKLSTLLHLVWFVLIWKFVGFVISYHRKRTASKSTPSSAEVNKPLRRNESELTGAENAGSANDPTEAEMLSFSSTVKIGFVKLIKLNFTSSANILVQMIHCERIGNQLHLYVYGDYICYSWWQLLVMIVGLPIVILFPLSFGVSLDLMKDRKITTNSFLLSCAMPFVTLWFQLRKMLGKLHRQTHTAEDERCIEEILQLEEELYKPCHQTMRWPVVQLYRNLLVVILDIYILNREYKILWFVAVFIIFSLHDRYRMPFKHPYLNELQRLTSVCLIFIALCSVPPAFSSIGDIMAIPQMSICLMFLKCLEYCLYLLVPLSLPLWKLREYFQKRNLKEENGQKP